MKIQFQFLFVSLLISSLAQAASETCPELKLQPDNNPKAYQSLRVRADCDLTKMYLCPDGVLVLKDGVPTAGVKVVGGSCWSPWSESLPRRMRGVPESKIEELRAKALQEGVPSVIFERALANHRKLQKDGQTGRGCFLAADLTTNKEGTMWKICAQPQMSVTKMTTGFGAGEGDGCASHPYQNKECAQFFGNKEGYCLSAGGAYISGDADPEASWWRPFVTLNGISPDENDNTPQRLIGFQTKTNTTGGFSVPGKMADGTKFDDLARRDLAGGMAMYVYPSKKDILEFREKGSAPYWDKTCAQKIGRPGWMGTKDHAVPTPQEMANGNTVKTQDSKTVPGQK